MKTKITPCYLDVSSYVGISIGADHYYGHLKYNDQKIELKHRLTQKEADLLNKKDGNNYNRYKKGALSERFDTEEQVEKIAIKTWKQHFPDANILIKGSDVYIEPQPCIDGLKVIKDKINRLYKRACKLGWFDNGNDKIVDEICDEYYHKILGK